MYDVRNLTYVVLSTAKKNASRDKNVHQTTWRYKRGVAQADVITTGFECSFEHKNRSYDLRDILETGSSEFYICSGTNTEISGFRRCVDEVFALLGCYTLLHCFALKYRGADKSLARPNWKNNWKVAIFPPTRRSLLPRKPGWTNNILNCFWVACRSQSLVAVACFFPDRVMDLSAPRYVTKRLSETSVNYQHAMRNDPEQRRPHEYRTLDQHFRKWAPQRTFWASRGPRFAIGVSFPVSSLFTALRRQLTEASL